MEIVNELTFSSNNSRQSVRYWNNHNSDYKSASKEKKVLGGFIAQGSQDSSNQQSKFKLPRSLEAGAQEKMFSHKVFSYREQKQLNNLNTIRLRDRAGAQSYQKNQLDNYENKLKRFQKGKEKLLWQQQQLVQESQVSIL